MDEDSLVGRLATRVGASPAEVVGLLVLVLGGLLAVVLMGRASGPHDPLPGPVTATLAPSQVLVHVTGAVRRPGVVEVDDGARVIDAIALAGGAAGNADLGALNLARLVVDGEQVVVPVVRGVSEDVPSGVAVTAFDAEGRLNLNTATAQDFEQLPGIGPVLAQRLVRHRETNGRFGVVGDLRAVSGIGEKTFQALAPMVFV